MIKPVTALLLTALLAACAPRLTCQSMDNIVVIRGQLAGISAENGIDLAEATHLAWYYGYTRVSVGGTLCGPVLQKDVWVAEFKAAGSTAPPITIRIDAETGGATSPGLPAVSLGEATAF